MSRPAKWQISQLWSNINRLKLTEEEKKDIVVSYTKDPQRTSFTHLTFEQARDLLEKLKNEVDKLNGGDECNRIRRRIIAIAHNMGWHLYDEHDRVILNGDKPVIDMDRINVYCLTHTAAKKVLNDMTKEELQATAVQFNQYYLTTIKAKK